MISRPCYDKPHCCPGWAGPGLTYAETPRCDNGHINRATPWSIDRCHTCQLVVLPTVVRWLDPAWWGYLAARRWGQ